MRCVSSIADDNKGYYILFIIVLEVTLEYDKK